MNFFLFSGFLRLMWISSVRLALHSSLNLMLFYDYMIICDYCEYLCISVFFFPFANVCSTHVLNCYDKSKLFRDYMIICDCCDYLCISVCFFHLQMYVIYMSSITLTNQNFQILFLWKQFVVVMKCGNVYENLNYISARHVIVQQIFLLVLLQAVLIL